MPTENTESPEKNYTKAELDTVVQARVDAATAAAQTKMDAALAAVKAPFEGIDVAEYKRLKEAETKRSDDALLAKGQYDQLLANTVKEKDAALERVQKDAADQLRELTIKLERSEVDAKLLSAATSLKALRPDQVASLLRGSIKFDTVNGATIVDASGNILSKDGKPVTVEEHVKKFLEDNPHFVPASPGGAGSQGTSGGGSRSAFTLSAEDAKDPAKYRVAREAAMKAGKSVEIVR